jgi:hypothetical protein
MALTIVNRTNPASYIQEFIDRYVHQRNIDNQMQADQQGNEDQRKRQLAELIARNPKTASQVYATNPELFAGVNVPQYQPSAKEQLEEKAATAGLKDFDTLPQHARQAGTYQVGYGAPMPKEAVDAAVANDVYSNPNGFAPQMQQRQGVSDKLLLSAQEGEQKRQWGEEFTKIKLPESGSKIATDKSQQTSNYASAGANKAQAGLYGAQTDKTKAETGQLASGGGADKGKFFTQERQLRSDFLKEAKNFPDLKDQIARINEAGKSPSAQNDIAMLFNFMKMLDPHSVVRESEYATAEKAGSWLQRAEGALARVQNGQKLEEGQRRQFVGAANQMYKAIEPRLNGIVNQYRGTAKQYGLNPDNVVTFGAGANEHGGGSGGAGKSVTRAELKAMGSSEQEAKAAGYTVTD